MGRVIGVRRERVPPVSPNDLAKVSERHSDRGHLIHNRDNTFGAVNDVVVVSVVTLLK